MANVACPVNAEIRKLDNYVYLVWHDVSVQGMGEGRDKSIRFRASAVTLTVETVARMDKDGSGKIR